MEAKISFDEDDLVGQLPEFEAKRLADATIKVLGSDTLCTLATEILENLDEERRTEAIRNALTYEEEADLIEVLLKAARYENQSKAILAALNREERQNLLSDLEAA